MALQYKRRFFLSAISLIVMTVAVVAEAENYRNEKYGFAVDTPSNLEACMESPPNPNHGIVILLDDSVSCNTVLKGLEARIMISGDFNSSETKSLRDLSDEICSKARRFDDKDDRVSIGGLASDSCLVRNPVGTREIIVVAQRHYQDNIDAWINYEAILITNKARMNRDMARFRAVLGRVRIIPVLSH